MPGIDKAVVASGADLGEATRRRAAATPDTTRPSTREPEDKKKQQKKVRISMISQHQAVNWGYGHNF
jgi:hypothetical protein